MPIEAGPETDLAVARACGFRNPQIIVTPDGPRCFRDTPDDETKCIPPIEKRFRPSTDLNDAFLAAEKFGLFSIEESYPGCEMGRCIGGWNVRHQDGAWILEDGMKTPALAICAAILKLSASASTGDPARPA